MSLLSKAVERPTTTIRLRLFLNANRLPKLSYFGQTSIYAGVTLQVEKPSSVSSECEGGVFLGYTEVINDDANPNWAKIFYLDYAPGRGLNILVQLFGSKGGERGDDDVLLSSATFDIDNILSTGGTTKAQRLKKGGVLYVRLEKCDCDEDVLSESSINQINFQLEAVRLYTGKTKVNTYFEIYRHADTYKQLIYRSNVAENSMPTNIVWGEVQTDLGTLCEKDLDKLLLFVIYRTKKRGKSIVLGTFETTTKYLIGKFKNMQEGGESHANAFLVHKMKNNEIEEVGMIKIVKCDFNKITNDIQVTRDYSSEEHSSTLNFDSNKMEHLRDQDHTAIQATASSVSQKINQPDASNQSTISRILNSKSCDIPKYSEYIKSGYMIDMCMAIDYTSSNGDPRVPGNLHYRHEPEFNRLNRYEQSIQTIGSAISKSCREQKFSVWGFGARFDGIVRNIFQCGLTSEVDGVDGILKAYGDVLDGGLMMSGPKDFTKVIGVAASKAAKSYQEYHSYRLLLILTDGKSFDMSSTVGKLKSVSNSPLSVIFVAVGPVDPRIYQKLLDSQEIDTCWRNNTSFVSFDASCGDPAAMSREALRSFPDQLVDYFLRNNIRPFR